MNTDKINTTIERFWNSETGFKYFVIVILAMIIVSVILTLGIIFKPIAENPPVSYSQDIYYPNKEIFCPGEKAEISIMVNVNRAPATIGIFHTTWSVDKNLTVLFDKEPSWTIVTNTGTSSGKLSFTIPDLPSGKYEYRRASSLNFSEPAIFVVPYIISDSCP